MAVLGRLAYCSLRFILLSFCVIYLCIGLSLGVDIAQDSATNEFRHHEQVSPLLFTSNGKKVEHTHDLSKGEHYGDITIVIHTSYKNFTLDMKLNSGLLSSSYVKRLPHPSGGYHIYRPNKHRESHCYYHGHIRGNIHSLAAISTCHGISGFWSDDEEFYHIEPSGRGEHFIYRDSDRKPTPRLCGYSHKHDLSASEQTRSILRRVKRRVYGPYDENDKSRYVELYLVNDYRLAKSKGSNKLEHRSKEIVNIVSKLYHPLNIYVALVGVEIWDQTDQVSVSADPNTTLDNFLRYRRERINPMHPNDNAQLLTGLQFDGGVVGKAVKGPICTFQYSGGVNMDYSSLVTSVATTVAHELGHNFGMHHDDSSCSCPQDRCIMASISGSASPTMWSSCSKQAVADSFHHGMDFCLRNKPEELFSGGICGNGFVEGEEECDCGLPEACGSRCCNATTCKLHPSAVCATGQCCDTRKCVPKDAATECRASTGECDLAEYCNGKSEFCPDDFYVEDGLGCSEGNAYCYGGKCNSHTSQCKLLWGDTGEKSNYICYEQLNKKGTNVGNCGYDWVNSRYKACRQEDVLCGMLLCVHKNEKLMFWKDVYAESLPASFIDMQSGREMYVCRGAVLDVGLDMMDPGLVPNGAKCGSNKMCVNQKCTRVDASLTPNVLCRSKCNGHGVCNNRGHCHCDPGYAPPHCDESGFGCSEDSGPCRLSGDKTGLLAGMLVLFLVIIPLIVLLIVAFCKRDQLQQWWKKQTFFKYRVPSVGKPPPQPSVQPSASVKSSNSVRENKFRSVSFRTGNPPAISNPVLTSSTNRNSQVLSGGPQSMETFKPPEDGNPIYSNVPPPRPPPPRPKSFREEAPPKPPGVGYMAMRNPNGPVPPAKPPTNRQRDIMLLQENSADNKVNFENSRLALKPSANSNDNSDIGGEDTLVSSLKARFDSNTDQGSLSKPRGRGVNRSASSNVTDHGSVSRATGRGVNRSASSTSATSGTSKRGGTSRGRGRGGPSVNRSHSGAERPEPPAKPPPGLKNQR